jgi:ribonucleotide reductase beta subunit family protein with ferritin-like domain
MIFEPFCLRACATENTDEYPDKWNTFNAEVKKRAEKANNAITKNVISVLKNRTKHLKSKSTKNKSFKVAILTGLLILCGFETGELVKQNDKLNSIKTHSNSINIDKFSYTNIQNSIKQFVKSFQN